MSETLSALLVILFIALPGMAGDAIYTRVTGTSWREEPWRSMFRIFAISLGGLILYVLVSGLLDAPLPGYLSLETLDTFALRRAASLRMSLAFLGHLIAAMVVGFAAGKVSRGLSGTAFVHGWHEFVSVHGSGHWAVVGVQDGTIYAGVIQMADPGKKTDGRDVILAEPAVYRADQEKYLSLPYNYLFLPGKIIDSVAIASSAPDDRAPSTRKSQPVVSGAEEDVSPR